MGGRGISAQGTGHPYPRAEGQGSAGAAIPGDVLRGAQPVVEMWQQETGQTGRRGAAVTSTR